MATPGKAIPTEPTSPEERKVAEAPKKKELDATADEDGHVESGPVPPDDRGL